MIDYLEESVKSLPKSIFGEASSPEVVRLLEVNDQGVALDNKSARMFHNIIAKLLCA